MAASAREREQGRQAAAGPVRPAGGRRLARLAAWLVGMAGVTLLLALVSYHAADPSLDTATSHPAANLAGWPGALAADLLLQLFGLAAVLPAFALLAWAWRLAILRPAANWPLRLLALLAALPVSAAALAPLPGVRGAPLAWPTAAGPGGAIGSLLHGLAGPAGSSLFGRFGPAAVEGLVALLALLLVVLAFGLSRREWRAAGAAVRQSTQSGAVAASLFGGLARRLGAAGVRLLGRLNGTAPPPPPSRPQADAPRTRAEPVLAAAPAPPAPAAVMPVKSRPAARKTPPVPPQQASLPLESGWRLPPLSLLSQPAAAGGGRGPSPEALQENARLLESVLADYGVQGQIVEICPGPVVTLYELEPAPGIRSARVIGLADDVARSLSVTAVRIATVPGRNAIGIEVPNAHRETVYLGELFATDAWQQQQGRLALALGKNIAGEPVIADLARMPHLLVAGTTGSGKSVGMNAMILSLVYRLSPEECRLLLIDPKMLELSVYDGIPHLLAPVVTEPGKAVVALKWTVREMERRYRAMSQLGVRNVGGYNERVAQARAKGEVVTRRVQTGFDAETGKPMFEEMPLALEPLPFIVVLIDEMADLMMVAGKEIEAAVQRLAQMARAAGIHVVMATQRPSVDVITGTIKANFATRISFQVISKFDSRTILGEQGAEQLLGQGDMLYMAGGGRITRVHGPLVADNEVEAVVAFLREQGEPTYLEEVTEAPPEAGEAAPGSVGEGEASLFEQAVDLVAREGKASTSFIQRHLQIGYNRAARLIEQMEKEGIVGPANHVGRREVLLHRSSED
jgi:S-DNA-T family DNA segregation ATPase FtsK/SpoIIIE